MKLNVNINDELVRWILGLGQAATVQSPIDLVQMVESEASKISDNYKIKKSA